MLQIKHSAILLTSIKQPVVIKIFVLSVFEWPFYTGFTVAGNMVRSEYQYSLYMRGTRFF